MEFATEFDALEYTADTIFNGLNYKWDLLMMEHDENIAAIEYKVLCENGTDEDLQMLFEAEASSTSQQSGGIISGIINAIKKLFEKLKEFLFGKPEEQIDPNEQYEIPDPDKLSKETKGIIAKLRSWASGHKLGERFVDANIDAILAAPITIGGAALGSKLAQLGKDAKDVDATMDMCANIDMSNMPVEEQKRGNILLRGLQKCGKAISRISKNIADKASAAYHGRAIERGNTAGGKVERAKNAAKIKALNAELAGVKTYIITLKNAQAKKGVDNRTAIANAEKKQSDIEAKIAALRDEVSFSKMDNSDKLSQLKRQIEELEKKQRVKKDSPNYITDDEKKELANLYRKRDEIERYMKEQKGKKKAAKTRIFNRNNPGENE